MRYETRNTRYEIKGTGHGTGEVRHGIAGSSQRGFTLVELILYIVLVTMMIGTLIPFAWNVIEGGAKAGVEQEVYSQARYLSERIKKEIRQSDGINTCDDTTISLSNPVSAKDPTVFTYTGDAVTITQGEDIPDPVQLNSGDTKIVNFSCADYTAADNSANQIQFSFTMASNFSSARQEYSESLRVQSSAELRNVALASPEPYTTITFDDASGTDTPLNGVYPTGVINWGTNLWYVSSPFAQFGTKNLSFNGSGLGSGLTSATFNFVTPRKLISIQASNGGSASSTITLSCSGNSNISLVVAVNSLVTITTNWTNPCSSVTVGSTNGWDSNFDNMVIQ